MVKVSFNPSASLRNIRTLGLIGRVTLSDKVKISFSDLMKQRELRSIIAEAFLKSSLKVLAGQVTEIKVQDIRFSREGSKSDTGAYYDEKVTIESASIHISWLLGANESEATLPINHTFHVSWSISLEGLD